MTKVINKYYIKLHAKRQLASVYQEGKMKIKNVARTVNRKECIRSTELSKRRSDSLRDDNASPHQSESERRESAANEHGDANALNVQ